MIVNQCRASSIAVKKLAAIFLFFSINFTSSCTTHSSKADAFRTNLTTEQDTIDKRQPSIADSIQLWIVPNHMLWVPLEFESTHAVDRAEKKY